jgi:cytochrome P450
VIGGRQVAKGTMIMVMPWVLHRHKLLWEDPERFDPERFSPARSAGRHRFAYLPFGGGPRICIGAAFAMTEAVLILATMAQRYRLRLVPDQVIEPHHVITLRPRHGMKMRLERRAAQSRA